MPTLPALRLQKGHTTHQRSMPFQHRFKYSLALIDIDIDRLEEASSQSRLFSIDKTNLFSFNRNDHASRDSANLRDWAEDQFTRAGITLDDGAIRLVTFPRHAFYKFAPISLWVGHGPEGEMRGILYEVNNTFGETHVYAAATPDQDRHRHTGEKVFHVSPFFDISGKYQFTLRYTQNQLSLIVATLHGDTQTHMATIKTKPVLATSTEFAKLAITKPFSSIGVTLAIHWQALKLWIKGAKYHSKPKQSETRITIVETKEAVVETASRRETTV